MNDYHRSFFFPAHAQCGDDLTLTLIELIKGFPILYDRNHREYGNAYKKKEVYTHIATELDVSDHAVYAKWKHLKYAYSRYCKPSQINSATKADGKRRRTQNYANWKWGPYLTFLNKSSTDKSKEQTSKKLLLTEEVDIKDEEDDSKEDDEDEQSSETLSCYSGGSFGNPGSNFKPAEDSNAADEFTVIFPPSPSHFDKIEISSEDSPAPMLKQMLDAPSIFHPPPMIARDIQVLGFKEHSEPVPKLFPEPIPKPIPELRSVPHRKTISKSVFEPASDSDSESSTPPPPNEPPEERTKRNLNKVLDFLKNKREKDPIDLLFESYGKTLKRLKPRTQSSIKIKLAQLFANYELKTKSESKSSVDL